MPNQAAILINKEQNVNMKSTHFEQSKFVGELQPAILPHIVYMGVESPAVCPGT